MKKALLIIGIIGLSAAIGLYIYSQGGYQDIHVAKGEHLDKRRFIEFQRDVSPEQVMLYWIHLDDSYGLNISYMYVGSLTGE